MIKLLKKTHSLNNGGPYALLVGSYDLSSINNHPGARCINRDKSGIIISLLF